MHRSHAQSRGFETHKTKAIESSIALFIKGQPSTIVMFLDAGSIVCLVMGCVMPLIPRLMKFWKLPIFKMKCRGQLFGWELSSVNEESATTEISRKTARD